jgi:hypothetical protein
MSEGKDRHQMALNILRTGGVLISGRDWKVAVWSDDNIQCSCPVSKMKKQECHHVKAVQMYLTAQRTGWRMW